MKKILILCLVTVLVPGFMAGCSKSEQPVQEQPLQEQSGVTMQESLQDKVTQADQAQQLADEAKLKAEEAVDAAQTKTAEVVSNMKEQLQGVSAPVDALKTADTGLASMANEAESAGQAVTAPASQEVKDLAASQTEGLKTPLDSALSGLDSNVANTTSNVTQAASEAGTTGAETAAAATNETASTAAGTTASDEVVNTANDATAVPADTTSAQI